MDSIIVWIERLAQILPLDWYVFFGAFIEEVIAPIPSPLIMTSAGTLALANGQPLIYLLWLAIMGAFTKTLGALVVYFIGDKAEDVVVGKFGKYFGVSHMDLVGFGSKFKGGNKDFWTMFVLRALPIMPSSPISLITGVIKVDIKAVAFGGFLGTIIRNGFFLYLGYAGLELYERWEGGLATAETYMQILLLVLIAGVVVWWKVRKK